MLAIYACVVALAFSNVWYGLIYLIACCTKLCRLHVTLHFVITLCICTSLRSGTVDVVWMVMSCPGGGVGLVVRT